MYPDVTRINPAYFKYLDRKIDYLEEHGFTVFLEAMRRDLSQSWRRYYPWPDSYTRYLFYLYTRYGAGNVILSPIHLDGNPPEMPATAFLPAINALYDKYGPPPFGNLSSTNTVPSTLVMWKQPGMDSKFLTLHQTGNTPREHVGYWYLTEEFFATPALPAFAGEPYYSGGVGNGWEAPPIRRPGEARRIPATSAHRCSAPFFPVDWPAMSTARSRLSAPTSSRAPRLKCGMRFHGQGGNYMKTLRAFVFSQGKRYQDLIPSVDFVLPNRTQDAAHSKAGPTPPRPRRKTSCLLIGRRAAPQSGPRRPWSCELRSEMVRPAQKRMARCGSGTLTSNTSGTIRMPKKPTDDDWGMRLVLKNVVNLGDGPAPPAGATVGGR